MKKLFTLACMMLLSCAMTFAQSAFEFVDAKGNVIPNGSTFEANGSFEDWEFMFEKQSGVFIMNNSGSDAKITFDVKMTKELEGMNVMVCPGGTCNGLMPGQTLTKEFVVKAGTPESIETHCSYEEGVSGKAEIELTLSQGGKEYSKIVVVFTTHDLAGIDSVIADNALCNVYDITGKLVKANVSKNAVYSMNKGLYIVRELAGEKNVNKVIVK